jgi:hypothetical protein
MVGLERVQPLDGTERLSSSCAYWNGDDDDDAGRVDHAVQPDRASSKRSDVVMI